MTREVNRRRQHRQRGVDKLRQNSKELREENNAKGGDPIRGIVTRKVPHLEKEMDQMEMAMEEMKDSMKRTHHMDDLIHRIDSPFTVSITSHLLPLKFKMPTFYSYDGTGDPYDYIATFKTTMHL